MPRISKAEMEAKRELINGEIFNLFLEEGFDAINMYNVSMRTGIRQSTLQTYHKADTLHTALTGKVAPYFFSKLNMETVEDFETSWLKAIDDSGFCNILTLLVGHITTSEKVGVLAYKGLMGLINAVEMSLGEDGRKSLNGLIGRSVIEIAMKKGTKN
ncbi:hypothetical protein [Vibrio mediterranei]|uniref:hypothetical protein n=1 Tax=Vibrio mediterranei TaxID=689 RepID=UPI00228471C2|nr:hypothetical protein [Vibrio mediterranei]MCY9853987.1 hypothetical protein [Vibrio mediterranei]